MQSDDTRPKAQEIIPACLLAGLGMVFAGTYLDRVKRTQTEHFDPQLLAIIPPLIGLKGNLEVTLSSRLATLANIKIGANLHALRMFISTLAYILIQGVSAAVVISTLCVIMLAPVEYKFQNLLHLTAISVLTCSLALCTLSVLVFGLIICCTFLGLDPDNVAPPMAAAFGDLGTVTLLLWTNYYSATSPNGALILASFILLVVFFFGPFLLHCEDTASTPIELRGLSINRNTLMGSVLPLLGAVFMSSLSGQVLAYFDQRLTNLARLQIAINGVGGCFGSVVVSRMITRIHTTRKRPLSPQSSRKPSSEDELSCCELPTHEVKADNCLRRSLVSRLTDYLFNSGSCACPNCETVNQESRISLHRQVELEVESDARQVSRLILFCCLPVHLVLALASLALHEMLEPDDKLASHTLPPSTIFAYLIAGFFQIFIVIHFAKYIVLLCWRHLTLSPSGCSCLCASGASDSPPSLATLDLAAVALTTGLGDLVGSILLATSMYCLHPPMDS